MNDLTPQLRTRLSRVERAVGVFVLLATVLLFTGFGYYVYHTADRKGWFKTKVRYCTAVLSAAGLNVGDPVRLWGFDIGEITRIDTQPPDDLLSVYVEFTVNAPYFGYLWTEGTIARITAADFLGKRAIEVTRGTNYCPTHLIWPVRDYPIAEAMTLTNLGNWLSLDQIPHAPGPNEAPLLQVLEPLTTEKLGRLSARGVPSVRLADRSKELSRVTMVWDARAATYVPYTAETKPYWLVPDESEALTEHLDGLIQQTERTLSEHLPAVMSNAVKLTAHANATLIQAQPLLSNITLITANLTNANGSLGQWLLPAGLHAQLGTTLTNADRTLIEASVALTNSSAMMTAANSNLSLLVAQLQPPLESLSGIISNLNTQVQANTNFVTTVSQLLVHIDGLIEGLKRHWLFRGAFKQKATNAPAPPPKRYTSPKGAQQ